MQKLDILCSLGSVKALFYLYVDFCQSIKL